GLGRAEDLEAGRRSRQARPEIPAPSQRWEETAVDRILPGRQWFEAWTRDRALSRVVVQQVLAGKQDVTVEEVVVAIDVARGHRAGVLPAHRGSHVEALPDVDLCNRVHVRWGGL